METEKKNWFQRNIVWFFTELIKLWSDEPSYFSKKRVESSLSFIVAQAGMITYFFLHYKDMDISTLLMWAGAEFLIAGYSINQIQKEKKDKPQ
jgi:hypothetical protein